MTLWVATVSVCVRASQRIHLSVLARNPHKGLAREISHETGRTRKGRCQRSVGMREQSREGEHSQQKGAEETSRQNRSVRRWESDREEISQQKSRRRLLESVDLQMPSWPTRKFKSASQTSPLLRLKLTQARDCLFFFHHPGCFLRICKEMWWPEMRKKH